MRSSHIPRIVENTEALKWNDEMIGSHIIPKFYLEQFASQSKRKNNPGRIWVYEKGKRPDERATSVQGVENGYFAYVRDDGTEDGVLEDAFEKHLAERENECDSVLFCSKSHLYHWPHGSRDKLAFYAALLYSRATQRREHSAKNSRYTLDVFERALSEDKTLLTDLTDGYSKRFGQTFTEQEICDLLLKPVLEGRGPRAEKNQFLTDLLNNAESIANLILNKPTWEVWQAPEGLEFITSDNPLVSAVPLSHGKFHPGYGFGKQEIIALFPLAPTACLAAGAFTSGTSLISAVDYRRGFQYLSAKGWNKAEPHEPSFQEPELLSTTLSALGDKVELTLQELCADLKFKPETFGDVTGMSVPAPKAKVTEVISFQKFSK